MAANSKSRRFSIIYEIQYVCALSTGQNLGIVFFEKFSFQNESKQG